MVLLLIAAVSFAVAVLFRLHLKSNASDLLFGALIFGPPLLFWLGNQSLSELGFGGAYAKFRLTAEKPVAEVWLKEVEDKLSLAADDWDYKIAPVVGSCLNFLVLRPNFIPHPRTSENPEFNKYIVSATNTIKSSITCGKLLGVVILDREGKYIASFDSGFFLESLSLSRELVETLNTAAPSADKYKELAQQIETTTIFGAALKYPQKRIKEGEGYVAFIKTSDTVKSAWEELQTIPGAFLAVTDRRRNFKGVLPRKAVENLLLDTLAFSASRPNKEDTQRSQRRRNRR